MSFVSFFNFPAFLCFVVALKYGDMDDFLVSRMILCGMPLDEPYLQLRLSILMREERKSLKTGKLPVMDCYYLMGTVDPTGLLKPNEVCVILYVLPSEVCSGLFNYFNRYLSHYFSSLSFLACMNLQ